VRTDSASQPASQPLGLGRAPATNTGRRSGRLFLVQLRIWDLDVMLSTKCVAQRGEDDSVEATRPRLNISATSMAADITIT